MIRLAHLQTLEGRRESQQTKGWKSCAKPVISQGSRIVEFKYGYTVWTTVCKSH